MNFETWRERINKKNEDRSYKNTSFDFKVFGIYHIAMMILFAASPFDNANDQALVALILGFILFGGSVAHKIVTKWKWPGLSPTSIPGSAFNVLFIYIFLAFASYSMTPEIDLPSITIENIAATFEESKSVIMQAASRPRFTPWYLAGIGIGVFNVLSSLNLVSLRKRAEQNEKDS